MNIEQRKILNDWGICGIPEYIDSLQRVSTPNLIPDHWHHPPLGSFNISFDGATKGNPGLVGYCRAIRNDEGNLRVFFGDT